MSQKQDEQDNSFDKSVLRLLYKGQAINYVSIFEGGGVYKMLTLADIGEGGIMNS